MNIRKIIKEEIDDFGWVKEIPDTVSHHSLKVGDMVELVYSGSDFWDGTTGIVVQKHWPHNKSTSIDVTTKDGDGRRLLFDDDEFDTTPYRFKIIS